MTSKARSLRERMSIDPDEPTPVAERRRPVAPARTVPDGDAPSREEPDAPAAQPAAPSGEPIEPAPTPRRARPASQPASQPASGSSGTGAPARRPQPAAVEAPGADAAAPAAPAAPASSPRSPARGPSGRAPGRRTGGRRSARDGVDWESAVDDPAITPGANGYRSFYVSDEVFARFRAAVYWTARRPDADDVPDNMSAGVEDYMDAVATDLERRYNDRAVFPPTPDQVRAHRRREGGPRSG